MAYSIETPTQDGSREAILGLWKRNFPEATAGRYEWLYEQGPARGWLLHADGREIVGAAGLMTRDLRVLGTQVQAAQAIDLNVVPSHRTIGPALQLERKLAATVAEGRYDLIYAFPNRESELVHRRLGYKPLGIFTRWAKPLRCEGRVKGWLRYPALRKAASAVVDAAFRIRSPETFARRPGEFGVEVTDRFDDRFDALCAETCDQFGVIGDRGASYLDWRFCRSPVARHRAFCLIGPGRRLEAYLVYSRRGGNLFLSDFLFRGQEEFALLLADFIRLARREKSEAIITSYLGSPRVCQTLARFGFLRRPSSWSTMIHFDPANRRLDAGVLVDSGLWHLTRADVDTDF